MGLGVLVIGLHYLIETPPLLLLMLLLIVIVFNLDKSFS